MIYIMYGILFGVPLLGFCLFISWSLTKTNYLSFLLLLLMYFFFEWYLTQPDTYRLINSHTIFSEFQIDYLRSYNDMCSRYVLLKDTNRDNSQYRAEWRNIMKHIPEKARRSLDNDR